MRKNSKIAFQKVSKNNNKLNKLQESNTALPSMKLVNPPWTKKIEFLFHSSTHQIALKICTLILSIHPVKVKGKENHKMPMHTKPNLSKITFPENLQLSSNNTKKDPFIET